MILKVYNFYFLFIPSSTKLLSGVSHVTILSQVLSLVFEADLHFSLEGCGASYTFCYQITLIRFFYLECVQKAENKLVLKMLAAETNEFDKLI